MPRPYRSSNPSFESSEQLDSFAARERNDHFNLFRNVWIMAVIGLVLFVLGWTSVRTVPAGSRAVVTSFGRTTGEVLDPGIHLLAPWKKVTRLNTKLVEIMETMKTPTKSGLAVDLESSVWVSLDPSPISLAKFVNEVGPENFANLVSSAKRNVTRDVIADYTYEELYSVTHRTLAGQKILQGVQGILAPKGILVDRVLLRNATPPESTTVALEKKAAAQQAAEAMKYTIEKEELEIQRKEKEAQGIAKANREISESLSPAYLQWYYIKSLEGLAHSTNTTFVIVPYDQKLTPMLNIK